MSVIAVIPARYGSSRFPGKPLALIQGKPMIQWVYERVRRVTSFDDVIVATDDTRIYDTVKGFGGWVEMTAVDHPSGTDRVWEVVEPKFDAEYVFNIQGDEPLLNPLYLEDAIRQLKGHHGHVDIVTLKAPIHKWDDVMDPNVVKVVTNHKGHALYFSRAPIPFGRDEQAGSETWTEHVYRHVGLYGYTRAAIERFVGLSPSPLEQLEKLEQLRALEAGMTILALNIPEAPIGVDTPEDLARLETTL